MLYACASSLSSAGGAVYNANASFTAIGCGACLTPEKGLFAHADVAITVFQKNADQNGGAVVRARECDLLALQTAFYIFLSQFDSLDSVNVLSSDVFESNVRCAT